MEHLVVRLHEDSGPAQWAVFDDDGRVVRQAQSGPLADAAAAAAGRRVVVLVPGADVVLTEATLPKASPARLRKMLPFSLEDTLAEDVEELAFAVGERRESGAVAVAVISRARLEARLAELSAAGLVPQAVYSEAEGVPDTPSTLALLVEDERIYGRAPGRPAFMFEGLSLGQIVDVVDDAGEHKHAVVYVDETGRTRHGDELHALGERIESTQVKLMGDGALYRLGATLVAQPGTNLLQGEYAPKSNVGAMFKPWRAAAALFLGLVLVSVAAQAAEYFSLRQQNEALAQRLTEVCRQELSTTLDGCERIVRQRLSQAGIASGGAGFLTALSAIAEARAPDSQVSQMTYRGDRLILEVLVPSVSALDAFVREAQRSGVFADVRVRSTGRPTDEGIPSSVELVAAGAEP